MICKGPEISLADLGIRAAFSSEDVKTASVAEEKILAPIPDEGLDLESIHQEIERYYLQTALEKAMGNETVAAKLLNLNYHTYRYRLKNLFKKH